MMMERFENIIEGLRNQERDIVLLDYEKSEYPVSHALMLKELIEETK